MGRYNKQIYTASKKDNAIIEEWLDAHQMSEGNEKKLWFQIMEFYFDWAFTHNRKLDAVFHNSIYRILMAIGMNPLTDKEKEEQENGHKQKVDKQSK